MKKIVSCRLQIVPVLLCLLGILSLSANFRQDPLLVCAIMIKNEAPVIENTLKSMVNGGIDSFLIFDTGSTDDTIDKINNFFLAQTITNYVIEQEEFVDFSTSRNRALDLVDKYFPQATFILMPDAEWMIHNGPELLKFCQEHKHDNHASYLIRLIQCGGFEFYVERLIRRNSHTRFKFPVHEYLESASKSTVSQEIYIEYKPTQYGSEKSLKRFARDLELLLKEYAKNPKEPRIVFYIAQTYTCLGDNKNAMRFYELRTNLDGWTEENFMAMYRLAQIVEAIAQDDTNKETPYDWALAEWYYLKAFSMRSTRIEPLIRIAQHYLASGKHALAYLFASRASQIPYPDSDILFVEKEMYTYTRYDILGQSAWYIAEYNVGEWALKKALEYNSNKLHLHFNLSFYLERNYQNGYWKVRSLDTVSDTLCNIKLPDYQPKEWSILICTLPERKELFERLVNKLKSQIKQQGLEDQIEILYFLDNREFPIGFKRNKLIQESQGLYVNFIDDDDDIHDQYIAMIYEKLQAKPDCVSLVGIFIKDGQCPMKFIHSIKYDHYFEQDGIFYRPPNHLNPMRRDIAIRHKFPLVSWHEDFFWASEIAKSKKLNKEEELLEPYYFYLCKSNK